MSMETALPVVRLVAALGEIEGRKRLQKLVHLLQAYGHTEFQQDFVLHYYGPYSRELAGDLDLLCQTELVTEEKMGDTYRYTPAMDSSGGETALDSIFGVAAETPSWLKHARELNACDTSFLEALSTVVYLRQSRIAPVHLKARFAEAKPRLVHLFEKVFNFAKDGCLI